MLFTEEEKLRVVALYYANDNSAVKTVRQYGIKYPRDRIPSRQTIDYIVKNHNERKTLQRKKRNCKGNIEADLNILLHFQGRKY